MAGTFTFEEAQAEQPKTFSFEEAGSPPKYSSSFSFDEARSVQPDSGLSIDIQSAPRNGLEQAASNFQGERSLGLVPGSDTGTVMHQEPNTLGGMVHESVLDDVLPNAEVKPEDSRAMAVGKEVYNLVAGIPKFVTSPLGIGAALTSEISAPVTTGLFLADTIKSLGQQTIKGYEYWDNMTPGQKAAAVTSMVGTGAFAGLLGLHVRDSLKPDETFKLEPKEPDSVEWHALRSVAPLTADALKQSADESLKPRENIQPDKPLVAEQPAIEQPPAEPTEAERIRNNPDLTDSQKYELLKGGATETPLNPGGSQDELPPELQAQSKENNSKEAFERVQHEADADKTEEPENSQQQGDTPSTEFKASDYPNLMAALAPRWNSERNSFAAGTTEWLSDTYGLNGDNALSFLKMAWHEFKDKSPKSNTEEPIVDQSVNKEDEPKIIGMGGATQDEFDDSLVGSDKYGIAARVRDERAKSGQVAAVEPGEGISAPDSVERGRELLKEGVDPELVMNDFEKTKRLSSGDMAAVRAHGEKLSLSARRIEEKFGTDSDEYRATWKALSDWDARSKVMQTEWHKTGQAQQGETDIDTGSFTALQRAHKDLTGKDFTPSQTELAKELSKKSSTADKETQAAVGKLFEALDEENKTKQPNPIADIAATQKPRFSDEVLKIAKGIVDKWDARADAARIRLKERLARTSAGLDPTILADLAEVGLSHAGHIALDSAEFGAKLVEEFGDFVKPHIQEIVDATKKLIAKEMSGKSGSVRQAIKEKPAVEKTTNEIIAQQKEKIVAKTEKDEPNSITPQVKKIAESLYAQGVHELEPMIDILHGILKETHPEITRQETMDALSGRGKFWQASQDAVKKGVRDLSTQARLVGHQMDVEAGKPLPRTGYQPDEMSDAARREAQKLEDLKRKHGVVITDPEAQLASALQARKTYYTHRMADLKAEIASGERRVKSTNVNTDAELDSLKAEYQKVKAEHDSVFSKDKTLTDEQRLKLATAGVERQMEDLERRMREGDFKGATKKPITGPELEAAKARRDALLEQYNELRDLDEHYQQQQFEKGLSEQKKALEDSIYEKQNKLATGDVGTKSSEVNRPAHPELEQLKQERDALNKQLSDARKKPAEQKYADQLAAKVRDLRKRITEKEAAIAKGDVGTTKAQQNRPASSPELEVEKQRLEAVNKKLAKLRKGPKKTPEEHSLQALKTRLTTKMADLKERLAKGDFSEKETPKPVLDAEAEALQSESEKVRGDFETAKRRAIAAGHKDGTPFTSEEVRAIWEHARDNYVDKGTTDFTELVHNTATDLGMKPEDVRKALSQPKGVKRLTDEVYARMSERRKAQQSAKNWLKDQQTPGWLKFARMVPRAFFINKIFGHGTVGMITHAGLNIFNPTSWRTYWPAFIKQYGLVFKPAYHERMMQDLVKDPNYITAKRAGLANDPHKYSDDYQNAAMKTFMGKLGGLVGNRGFDALKLFRQARFNQIWNSLPETIRTPDMAKMVADSVNHATGIVKMPFREWTGWAFFAPKLEGSRWAWMFADTAKAGRIIKEWKTATPEEKAFAMMQVREKAAIAGTYASLLAINQGLLSATGSQQKINYTDPHKGDFLSFKVVGHNVGVVGPMLGMVRLLSNLVHDSVGKRKGLDKLMPRGEKFGQDLGKYARGKLSPFAGDAYDVAAQSDFQGRPLPWSDDKTPSYLRKRGEGKYGYGEYALQQFSPIPVEEAIKEVWASQGMNESQINTMWKAITVGVGAGSTGARISRDYDLEKKGKFNLKPSPTN